MKMKQLKIAGSMLTMSSITMGVNIAMANNIAPTANVGLPQEVITAVNNILGAVTAVGILVALVMIIWAGFKYMTAGAGEKAKAKDMLIPWAVGAIMVAAAAPIAKFFWGLVTGSTTTTP